MATFTLGTSESCSAVLNYDPLGLTASSVTIDNSTGINPISFNIVVSGITNANVAQSGLSQVMAFLPPMLLASATPLIITNLNSFGMGTT